MRNHWPIAKTTLAAVGSWALLLWAHWDAVLAPSVASVGWILGGLFYAQLAEYGWHRVPMHRRVRFLEGVRKSHLHHHRVFHGDHFQARSARDRKAITGHFWAFPALLATHYAALAFVLEAPALVLFLSAATLHYVVFEISHWLVHLEDNAVDRVIARVPWLASVRAYQIEHHRAHHERPELAFNFNPPYLGDRIAGHMPSLAEAWPPPVPEPIPDVSPTGSSEVRALAPVPVWRRRLVRYGSAAAVGLAVVGTVFVAKGVLNARNERVVSSSGTTG